MAQSNKEVENFLISKGYAEEDRFSMLLKDMLFSGLGTKFSYKSNQFFNRFEDEINLLSNENNFIITLSFGSFYIIYENPKDFISKIERFLRLKNVV